MDNWTHFSFYSWSSSDGTMC